MDRTHRTRSWRSARHRSHAADRSDPWSASWDAVVTPAVESWTRMWNDALDAARVSSPGHRPEHYPKHHHDACGCERDCCDDACRCCIGKADVVVYAYPGERRLIPMVIENTIRREREVTLELSGFDNAGKCAVTVVGTLAGEKTFKLAPCSEHEILIGVEIAADNPNSTVRVPGRVDTCCVYYADLRITGCDIRPVRIAVAVLPFDCDRHVIDCACGCC